MNEEWKTYDQIKLYLQGELVGESLEEFEFLLNTDAELAELVLQQKQVNSLVNGSHLAKVKQQMDKDFSSGRVNSKYGGGLRWFVFASTCLVLGLLTGALFLGVDTESIDDSTGPIQRKKSLKLNRKITRENKIDLKSKQISKRNKVLPQEPYIVEVLDTVQEPIMIDSNTSESIEGDISSKVVLLSIDSLPEIKVDIKTVRYTGCDSTYFVSADVNSSASCFDTPTGEIKISDLKIERGEFPVSYILVGDFEDSLVKSSSSFSELASTSYTLYFKDINNCIIRYPHLLFVEEENCDTKKPQSFSPNYNEVFPFSVPKEEDAEIFIYSRTGTLVFQSEMYVREPGNWDGKDRNGSIVKAGVYFFIIKYRSGTSEQGEVLVY